MLYSGNEQFYAKNKQSDKFYNNNNWTLVKRLFLVKLSPPSTFFNVLVCPTHAWPRANQKVAMVFSQSKNVLHPPNEITSDFIKYIIHIDNH